MSRTLFLQLFGFFIYFVNHLYHLIFRFDAVSAQIKIGFCIFFIVISSLFIGDYWLNYRKTGNFRLSASLLIIYSCLIWLFDGFYVLAAVNAMILTGFIIYKKQFGA